MVTLKELYKNTLVVHVNNEEIVVTYNNDFRITKISGGGRYTLTPHVSNEIQKLVYRQA